MKHLIFTSILLVISACCFAQSENSQYDAQLAKKVGADEYGMKTYVMAFLRTGPNRPKDSIARAELQKAHLKNITRLADEGKLIIAGPFLDDQDIRGIFIFNVSSVEEAKKLTESDPAVKAGSLIVELHLWYGSAGLVEAYQLHKKVQKKSVAE